jgi:O-antigen/teichoic acid export membrane protein
MTHSIEPISSYPNELMPELAPEPVLERLELQTDPQVHAIPLRRNVLTTILARGLYMVTRVGIPPFVLARIGLEAYGIWTTVFILVTYLGLTTMGISNVYIKYVAEFHARREYDKANSLLSTGLAVTVPACTALFLTIWLGWSWFSPILHLPASHAGDGKEAVLIVAGVFLSSIAFNVFGDVLTGMQQIAATQYFWTLSFIVEFVLIFVLVGMGRGIRGLAEAYLIRTVINDGLTLWWAYRKLPWLRLSWRLARRESVRYVVHFGGLVQFQSLLSTFLNSIERVAALMLVNVSAAGLLDLAKKWPLSLSSVPTAFFAAFLPAASHLDASSDKESRLRNLGGFYLRGARYSNLSTAFFCGVMVFWSSPILHIWLGNQLPAAGGILSLFVIFSVSMQFHMLTGPGTSIMRGMGRVWEEFSYSVPNLILLAITLPLSRWFVHAWTPLGIGIAVAAATVGSACVLMARVMVVLRVSFTAFLRQVIMPGLIPYLAAFLLSWPVLRLALILGRWPGAGMLMVAGLLYTSLTLLLLDRFTLQPEEQHQLRLLGRRIIMTVFPGARRTAGEAAGRRNG